jgi:PAS domain S-box-containing protein
MSAIRVLLIDDEPAQIWLVQAHLSSATTKTGKEITLLSAESLKEGFERLAQNDIDILLLDLSLPDSFGAATFAKVRARFPELPTVVLTNLEDEEMGIGLVQSGAQDYLVKGQISDLILFRTIRHAIERKQTELALRESEENYRLLFESSNDAIMVCTMENGVPGHFFQVNDIACQRFGYSRAEMLRMGPPDIVAPESLGQLPATIAAIVSNTQFLFELNHRTSSGGIIPVEINARLFQIRNRTMLLSIVRDITERKRAEAEKERLIADLKTALSQVKTLSGLLPICSCCKKIRDDQGYWSRLETYITDHSEAQFSHGLCPDCMKHYLPDREGPAD